MKAAFLIRCSTKNQDLNRQIRDLTRLAKSMRFEYNLEDWVYGEKITGKDDVTKKNRDSIDRLLKDAKEQKFDVVLVSEVSRMSRDPASGRIYVRLLINMNIPVYFKDIDQWTIDPETRKKIRDAELVIGAGFDAAFKYLKSMKTQIASARRNELDNDRISIGQPYFGYERYKGADKDKKNQIVVNELEAEVVQAVYNEYLKEGATLKSTALAITDKYGEKLNKKFSLGTIEHILTYDSYATGIKKIKLKDPDTDEVEEFDVNIPTIINKVLYEAVANKRKKNRVKDEPYPSQQVYLLSKLIKCPDCGYTLTPRKKAGEFGQKYRLINGKPAISWVCMSGINNSSDCTSRISISNEKLEPIIWELVKNELIGYADLNEEKREAQVKDCEEKIEYQNYSIQNFTKEIEKLKKRLSAAYEVSIKAVEIADNDEDMKAMAMEEFNRTAKNIRQEMRNFEKSIEQAKGELERLVDLKTFYSQPTLPKDYLESIKDNLTEKRNLVKQLITKIVPYSLHTFKKKERESGSKTCNKIITVKNGIMLLEVYTVGGVYNIFYNANSKFKVKTAYYINGEYATFQNGIRKFPAYDEGEYFVISNASMVMDTDDVDEVVSVNDFVDIAMANNWILEYQY